MTADSELNKIIGTEGISRLSQIEASKKKQLLWADVQVTNRIIEAVQAKADSLNKDKERTGNKIRGPFELEFSKREIFLMYFCLDIANLVDFMNPIKIGDRGKEESKLQQKRENMTYSARVKLSVFFNPSFPFTKGI